MRIYKQQTKFCATKSIQCLLNIYFKKRSNSKILMKFKIKQIFIHMHIEWKIEHFPNWIQSNAHKTKCAQISLVFVVVRMYTNKKIHTNWQWTWNVCEMLCYVTNLNWTTVLERPSSQMSYLDHFLKETGGSNASTHTASTLAANMVSLFCPKPKLGEISIGKRCIPWWFGPLINV